MRRLAFLVCAFLAVAPAALAQAVDLSGNWYVLVHYKDEVSGKPDAMRWEDRIWIFQKSGESLEWKEYPIVVFDDDEGRFERTKGRYSRVVAAWEPSPGQQANIQAGLHINTRGSKTKTLTGSDAAGWKSVPAPQAQAANVVTYSETWAVKDAASKPVFLRNESLGSGVLEALEGGTIYKTESVSDGELRGTFERDGNRKGTFRMVKTGPVQQLSTDKSPNEKQRERIEEQIREQLKLDGALTPDAINKALDEQESR
jgi:hypothetical protein